MWKYVTSIAIMLITSITIAQNSTTETTKPADTAAYKKTYGLRIGIDAASLIRTIADKNYTGFQALADYRVNNRWYAAGELGTERMEQFNERIDAIASGQYIKLGADYNFYQNWLDMDNMVYAGFRVGYSTFNQNLKRYDYYQDNTFFVIPSNVVDQQFNGLNAIWAEVQLGLKVEVLSDFYLSFNVQLKRSIIQDQPDTFNNLFVPGFGRTNDLSNIGVGYAYGISYRIPINKK